MPIGRPVSFWMRFGLIERIDKAAKAAEVSRSEWVLAAISAALAKEKRTAP